MDSYSQKLICLHRVGSQNIVSSSSVQLVSCKVRGWPGPGRSQKQALQVVHIIVTVLRPSWSKARVRRATFGRFTPLSSRKHLVRDQRCCLSVAYLQMSRVILE